MHTHACNCVYVCALVGCIIETVDRAEQAGAPPAWRAKAAPAPQPSPSALPAPSNPLAPRSTPTALAMAPPGSGELLPELKRSGALAHLLRAGVRHVDVNAIDDNILWRPADPVFIGFASASRAAAAAKVVEPGSVARAYSALSAGFPAEADVSELLDSAALQAPAVGCYYFSAPALEKVADAYLKEPLAGLRLVPARGIPKRGSPAPLPALPPNLPPQARAQALAAAARAAEAAAAPRPVEGYALQRFVADVLRYGDLLESGSIALLAVPRDEEFATIWSRGPHWSVDAPEGGAARALGLHTAWVENAGGEVAAEEGVEVGVLVFGRAGSWFALQTYPHTHAHTLCMFRFFSLGTRTRHMCVH